jgi:hypothetical protein
MLGFLFHNLDLFPHLFPRFGFATPLFSVFASHPLPGHGQHLICFGGGMFPTGAHRAVFEIPPPSITCGRKKMGNRSVSGGCGQRFNLPPTPWVKARTGGIGPGRSAPQPLALAIGHRTGKASTGHRACKVRRAASIRARAGTAPRQGQAVTQQGTGHRAPGTGTRSRAGLCMGRRAQASRAASIRAGQHQTKGK